MDIRFLSVLSGLFLLFLGVIVWYKNKKHPANLSLSIFAISSAFWCISLYFYENPAFYPIKLWIILVYLFVFIMIGSTLYFSFVFPNGNPKEAVFPTVLYSLVSIPFIYFLLFSNLWVIQVTRITGSSYTTTGPVYIYWGIYNLLIGIWIVSNFIKRYKTSGPLNRLQLMYVFLGIGVMAVGTLGGDVLVPIIFGNTSYFWMSSFFIIPFIGLSSYAIIKHRLFNIRLVIARSISYSLLLIILGLIYASGLFIITTLITKKTESTTSLINSTVLALIIAYTFQPLRNFLEKVTDDIFFKESYDPQKLLHSLSTTMATSLTLSDVTYKILSILARELRLTVARIAFIKEKEIYISESDPEKGLFKITKEELEEMYRHGKMLIQDEMEEGTLKELMIEKNISLALPLSFKKHFLGFLLLSEKASGEMFYDNDIEFLSILGPEMSIALQNAQQFEEISQFNITLQEEVKRATSALESANKKLTEADAKKDEFISIASHDLRSPLSIIKNNLWVAENSGKIPDKIKDSIDVAVSSNEHAINLVNDMLDVSRIEMGRVKVDIESFDLIKVIKEVYEDFSLQAKEKGINLACSVLKEKKKVLVKADKERVYQIFSNLINNALKFTPKDGEISINLEGGDKFAKISVTDTGVGINKEDFPKLFTKFGRLDNTLAPVSGNPGTGLGLYISKKLVTLFGGRIWVESSVGKGSEFIFTLPKASA